MRSCIDKVVNHKFHSGTHPSYSQGQYAPCNANYTIKNQVVLGLRTLASHCSLGFACGGKGKEINNDPLRESLVRAFLSIAVNKDNNDRC